MGWRVGQRRGQRRGKRGGARGGGVAIGDATLPGNDTRKATTLKEEGLNLGRVVVHNNPPATLLTRQSRTMHPRNMDAILQGLTLVHLSAHPTRREIGASHFRVYTEAPGFALAPDLPGGGTFPRV